MSLSFRLLKTIAIVDLDDDKWCQLVYLATHRSLDERETIGGLSKWVRDL